MARHATILPDNPTYGKRVKGFSKLDLASTGGSETLRLWYAMNDLLDVAAPGELTRMMRDTVQIDHGSWRRRSQSI
jgi:hypothetical protein